MVVLLGFGEGVVAHFLVAPLYDVIHEYYDIIRECCTRSSLHSYFGPCTQYLVACVYAEVVMSVMDSPKKVISIHVPRYFETMRARNTSSQIVHHTMDTPIC